MQDRGTGDVIKKEDELIPAVKKDITERLYGYCRKFVDLVTYMDAFDDTLDGFLKFINSPFFVSYYITQYKTNCKSLIVPFVKRNWDKDENYKKYIDERIKENKDYAKKLGYKDVPDESMADVIEDWWIGLDEETKKKICFDEGYDDDKGEYFKDLGEIPDDLIDWWERLPWKEALGIYHSYYVLRKVESIWSDMQDRGNGDSIKAEDDIEHLDRDGLYDHIFSIYKTSVRSMNNLPSKPKKSDSNSFSICLFSDGAFAHRIYTRFDDGDNIIKLLIFADPQQSIEFYKELADIANVEPVKTESNRYTHITRYLQITNKDGSVTNQLCMDVIELVLSKVKNPLLEKREN